MGIYECVFEDCTFTTDYKVTAEAHSCDHFAAWSWVRDSRTRLAQSKLADYAGTELKVRVKRQEELEQARALTSRDVPHAAIPCPLCRMCINLNRLHNHLRKHSKSWTDLKREYEEKYADFKRSGARSAGASGSGTQSQGSAQRGRSAGPGNPQSTTSSPKPGSSRGGTPISQDGSVQGRTSSRRVSVERASPPRVPVVKPQVPSVAGDHVREGKVAKLPVKGKKPVTGKKGAIASSSS